MSLETCRLCKEKFEFKYDLQNDSLICKECMLDEAKIVEYVQNFLDTNNSNILRSQIYKKTGVSTRYLQQLINEEKIKWDNIELESFCINCGEPAEKLICDNCKITFKHEIDRLHKALRNKL
ncbi:MAG: hypothetical protein ATN32_03575 [Candidatus Epulonipiscium fishelsonii]|nr:MAG: hypothetical protein ATN32_03575 [Epulopiscium sp. AS2M-Bin002]